MLNYEVSSTWRRRSLRVITVASLAFPAAALFAPATSSAQTLGPQFDPSQYIAIYGPPKPPLKFQGGFSDLAEQLGDEMGQPVVDEHPGDEPDLVVQETTTGLAYWSPEHFPSFFDGYHRAALLPSGSLTRWEGDEASPPDLTFTAAAFSSGSPPGRVATPARTVWDVLAGCEASGNWANASNPRYKGGLQMDSTFWARYGGLAFAPAPHLASREQQIIVAERGQRVQGWQAWPVCSRRVGLR